VDATPPHPLPIGLGPSPALLECLASSFDTDPPLPPALPTSVRLLQPRHRASSTVLCVHVLWLLRCSHTWSWVDELPFVIPESLSSYLCTPLEPVDPSAAAGASDDELVGPTHALDALDDDLDAICEGLSLQDADEPRDSDTESQTDSLERAVLRALGGSLPDADDDDGPWPAKRKRTRRNRFPDLELSSAALAASCKAPRNERCSPESENSDSSDSDSTSG
jgi:hypothetical protein